MFTDTEIERLYLGIPSNTGSAKPGTVSADSGDCSRNEVERWYLGLPFEEATPVQDKPLEDAGAEYYRLISRPDLVSEVMTTTPLGKVLPIREVV